MNEIDEAGIAFARLCGEHGVPGFCICVTEDGNTRLIGLDLPRDLVARMLRDAADAYEAQVAPQTLN